MNYIIFIFLFILTLDLNFKGIPALQFLAFISSIILLKKIILDRLALVFIFGFFLILSGYVWNLKNVHFTSANWFQHLNLKNEFIYFKIATNGLIHIISIIFFYIFLKSFNWKLLHCIFVLKLVVFISVFIALIDINSWISSGANIGRYNYTYIFTYSAGVSFMFSIIGLISSLILNDMRLLGILKIPKLFITLSYFILLLSMVINQVRLLQVTIAFILLIYSLYKNGINKSLIFFTFLIVIFFILPQSLFSSFLDFSSYTDLQFDNEDVDVLIRIFSTETALNLFTNNWQFGIGYGMFPVMNNEEFTLFGLPTKLNSVHNGFLSYLCEFGILGIPFYLSLYFVILKKLYSDFRGLRKTGMGQLNVNIFILLIFIFLEGFVGNDSLLPPPSEHTYFPITFLILILIVISSRLNEILAKK